MQFAAWDKVANEVDFNLEVDIPKFIEFIPQEDRVLDYGCGYGRNTEHLNRNGYINIVGIDTSGEMIERGRKMYPHLSFQQSNGEKLNFRDNYFDAVLVCAVLTCLPEQKQKLSVLSEIKRVLTPGGILHMVEFCDEGNHTFQSKLGIKMHHQPPQEIRSMLSAFKELSFSVTKTQTMGGNSAQAISYFGQNT